MSAFIKQIRETYKRLRGYDPLREKPKQPAVPLSEIQKQYPDFEIEPDPFDKNQPKRH